MSLVFCDGFDHYGTADILKKWSAQTVWLSTPSIITGGRNGGNRLNVAETGVSALAHVTLNFQSATTLIAGFFYSFGPGSAGGRSVIQFRSGTTVQCSVGVYADGRVFISNAAGSQVGVSTTTVASAGLYIEVKVTFADAGAFELRINGAAEASGTDDFKNGAAPASVDNIRLGHLTPNSGVASGFDDFYLCNSLGAVNNDFLGDCRVDVIRPNGAGNYSQFAPAEGVNWECVDDAAPNTTDYVGSTTIGHRDSYALENLTALDEPTIYAAQVLVAANKGNSGFRQIRPFVRSGGVDGDGAVATLGTSQNYAAHIYELNPNGDVAWTETTVNAMEAGVAVAA